MFKTRKGLLFIIILFLMGWGPFACVDMRGYFKSPAPVNEQDIIITTKAQKHILYGDERGGGHKFGAGKPCKSEFPQDWDNQKILTSVKHIAANDNLNWKEQNNGYFTTEQFVGNVKVRVVLNREKEEVVTAYPVNVKRNPCPTPANDNFNQ